MIETLLSFEASIIYSPINTVWHPSRRHSSKINVLPYRSCIPENKNLLISLRVVYQVHTTDGGHAQCNGGVKDH
jgi:capsule polysaccharide export protein KpsC/LpsZ